MWKFFEHEAGRLIHDPIEAAFFSEDRDEETARHLVRESIQNSLDARRDKESVRVRFTFGELETSFADTLFNGLSQHLSARGNGLNNPPGFGKIIKFLAIEDFGTTGLLGEIDQFQDDDTDSDDDFYYFWRNVGRTGKGGGTLGRWGLGKTVFPASSRINTFFGITSTANDPQSHLLGRCDLKSHRIDGVQYDPYGYFANWVDNKPMPISEDNHVRRISDAFHLKRVVGEPGLSIVIPHVVEEFNVDMLREEAIEDYFWPILNDQLIIEIQENYLTPPETVIDRSYLLAKIDDPDFQSEHRELADTIQLASWASSRQQKVDALVIQPSSGSASNWDNAQWLGKGIENIHMQISDDQPFAVQMQVRIKKIGTAEMSPICMVYGKPVAYRTNRKSYFSRQGINVSNACYKNPDQYVFLVVPNDGPLADMLGSAENPSHTDFRRTDAIKQEYEHGTMRTIDFLKRSPLGIAKALDIEDEEPDQGLFADVFWKQAAQKPKPTRNTRRRIANLAEAESDAPNVDVEKREPAFRIDKTDKGFRITDNLKRNWDLQELESISISVGYEVLRGDAIKRHSPFDFNFTKAKASGIVFDTQDCVADIIEPNKIHLIDLKPGYSFMISGFDSHRDLTIRATPRRTSSSR